MSGYFRGVAIDYDGTLTDDGRPTEDLLAALREVREHGRKVVLVTGRIVEELRTAFPDCADHFDLIVAENGGVVVAGSLIMRLGAPVPAALDTVLGDLGVVFRRGEVILATSANYEQAISGELRRQGLDCQLTRNRGELMVMPAGISKASGLRHALLQLGVSPRSAVVIGDAENDLAMFESCEISVAVANAVPSLKDRADVILAEPNGAGVAGFLRTAILGDALRLQPQRWQMKLGLARDGTPVSLPASQINILVAGGTGSGKSFAAGLIAEQLVQLGYVICVFDPEGDHAPLGALPNVVTLGGHDRAPAVEDLARIFEQSGTSVVVDLSLVEARARDTWTHRALQFLEQRRASTGVPHWLVIDEAHGTLGHHRGASGFDPRLKGHCVVTYRPMQLAELVNDEVDYALLVAGKHGVDPASARAVCNATKVSIDALHPHLDGIGLGEALVVRAGNRPGVQRLAFAPRWVPHVRHWHKYSSAQLPVERRFHFRAPAGLTGAVAGNMEEFHRELRRARIEVLRQHARGGDFSRWVAEVLRDGILAAALHLSERRLCDAKSNEDAEGARREMLAAIESRYTP